MFNEPFGGDKKPKGLILLCTLAIFLVLINVFIFLIAQENNQPRVLTQIDEKSDVADVSDAVVLPNEEAAGRVVLRKSSDSSSSAQSENTPSDTRSNSVQTSTTSQPVNTNSQSTFSQPQSKPSLSASKPSMSTGNIQVSGRDLLVNGTKFQIKGVNYQPTPIGYWAGSTDANWANPTKIYDRDFALLKKMKANTIRTFVSVSPSLVAKAEAYNLSIIAGYWVDRNVDLSNDAIRTGIVTGFANYVNQFKNSSAILMWAIGNEQNWFNGNNPAWYSLANEMARAAYEAEGANYHPSVIINGNLNNVGDAGMNASDSQMNYIDIWGVNMYRGKTFGDLFSSYVTKSNKPLLVTEFGLDSYNNLDGTLYENTQAEYDVALWNEINSSIAIGGAVFEYSDEYWKDNTGNINTQDNGGWINPDFPDAYGNEEYWGLVSVSKNGTAIDAVTPKKGYYAMRDAFRGYNHAPWIYVSDIVAYEGEMVWPSISLGDSDWPNDPEIYNLNWIANDSRGWQTNYGDAGNYTFNATVTDGSLIGSDLFRVIVLESDCITDSECNDNNSLTRDMCRVHKCYNRDINDCTILYESFENNESIFNNNGTIYGNTNFAPAVNNNGFNFSNNQYVEYENPFFSSENGTVSLWFKKNTNNTKGGLWQIGGLGFTDLGYPIGLFYNFNDVAMVEIGWGSYQAGVILPNTSNFTHITVTWETYRQWNHTYVDLYVDGEYKSGELFPMRFFSNYNTLGVGGANYYSSAKGIIDELRFLDYALNSSQVEAEYEYSQNNEGLFCSGNNVVSKNYQCVNGKGQLVDSIVENCSDGDINTADSCSAGACMHSKNSCIIPIDGMNITEDTTLCKGSYYLPGGLTVYSNVVLDGNDSRIYGDNYDNSAQTIDIMGSNITIKNLNVDKYYYGFYIGWYDYSDINFFNVNASNCYYYGLRIDDSTKNVKIQNSRFSGSDVGIYSYGAYNLTVENSTLYDNGIGLQLMTSTNSTVRNNVLDDNSLNIIIDRCFANSFSDNLVKNGGMSYPGVWQLHVGLETRGGGFGLADSYNNYINGNRIENNVNGFEMYDSSNNWIFGNEIINNAIPTNLTNSTNNWDLNGQGNHWSDHDGLGEGCNDTDYDYVCDAPYAIDGSNVDNYPAASTKSCTADSECSNGIYCDGAEKCQGGKCVRGTTVSCSTNDLLPIGTCTNSPDSNSFTFDSRAGFTSVCNENIDACTVSTAGITHTCDKNQCGAACESDLDCDDGDAGTIDLCLGNCSCSHEAESLPDLSIESTNAYPAAPGRWTSFQIILKNIGNSIANNIYWIFYTKSAPQNITFGPFSLNPNESVDIYPAANYTFAGNYSPIFVVDQDNLIRERDENNNNATVNLRIN